LAEATYYAWSPILYDADNVTDASAGRPKRLEVGDSVTKAKLGGVSDDDFKDLVESGAIRARKPPELPEGYNGSMVQFLQEEARKAELLAGDTALNLGGSYFGPNAEDLVMDSLEEDKK
jgi:hypothetical protein